MNDNRMAAVVVGLLFFSMIGALTMLGIGAVFNLPSRLVTGIAGGLIGIAVLTFSGVVLTFLVQLWRGKL